LSSPSKKRSNELNLRECFMTRQHVKPNTIRCKLCNTTAHSPNGLPLKMCQCGKCGIDTSDYFERFLGNREDFEYV